MELAFQCAANVEAVLNQNRPSGEVEEYYGAFPAVKEMKVYSSVAPPCVMELF